MCIFLISELPVVSAYHRFRESSSYFSRGGWRLSKSMVPTVRTNTTFAFLLSRQTNTSDCGILEITKPCPSVPENSSLYFSKTIFKVRKSDTTTGRKVTYVAPNLFRSFGLHPNKDKLKDSVTAYHKSKQSDGAIRSRKIRFVFRLLTFKAPVDSFGFVGCFFRWIKAVSHNSYWGWTLKCLSQSPGTL